ncbi:MAG: hypothetical protein IPN34_25565 [Planctomycetes bacterium]|nr:hypothetical protein [Planctomycetota bacterium]
MSALPERIARQHFRELAWVLCALSGIACSATEDADDARRRRDRHDHLDRARTAMDEGHTGRAVEELSALEQRESRDHEVQMRLGEALLAQAAADRSTAASLCARAERCFDRAAAIRPQDPLPWIRRASVCDLQDREAEALEHAERAERLVSARTASAAAGELAAFHLQRARRLRASGAEAASRLAAQAALRCQAFAQDRGSPLSLEAARARNDALILLGRSAEALDRTAQQIATEGGDERWHGELARCGRACADAEALARSYEDLSRRAPSPAMHWHAGRFWLERGEAARVQGRLAEAEAALRRAAEELELCAALPGMDPDAIAAERARALAGAAWIAFESEQLDEAARLWLAALRASPALASVGDVLDRSVLEGLERLAMRWAGEGREARASELLIAGLELAVGLGPLHARWLERMAQWSRREGTLLQRGGEASKARVRFERSRDAFRRAALLAGEASELDPLALRLEAASTSLHQLTPLLSGDARLSCIDDSERELRALLVELAPSSSSSSPRRELLADAHQLLGQLLCEHRGDLPAARAAFAACLAASPERAQAPELRWYLERLAEPSKETPR